MSIKKTLKKKNNLFILDAYAVLALIEEEHGSNIVAELLAQEHNHFLMNAVNLGEVFYIIAREYSIEQAEIVADEIIHSSNIDIISADWHQTRKAAVIKSKGGLSYADCFTVALGIENNAPVITGDKEIRQLVEKNPAVQLIWLG